ARIESPRFSYRGAPSLVNHGSRGDTRTSGYRRPRRAATSAGWACGTVDWPGARGGRPQFVTWIAPTRSGWPGDWKPCVPWVGNCTCVVLPVLTETIGFGVSPPKGTSGKVLNGMSHSTFWFF